MGIGIFLSPVISVIGSNQFYIMLFGKFNQNRVYSVFIFLVVSHQFYIEILSKFLFPPQQSFFSLLFTNIQDLTRHFSIKVPGKHDHIFFIFFDDFLVYTRHIIETVGVSHGRHLGQIVIAIFVLGQHHDLVTIIFSAFISVIFTNKELTSYDRL